MKLEPWKGTLTSNNKNQHTEMRNYNNSIQIAVYFKRVVF